MFTTNHTPDTVRGFTYIELVVTIGVMIMVMSITVLGNRQAQGPLKAVNNAYEVALFIREAQIRGTSIVEQGGSTNYAVGVYVASGGTQEVLMFQDTNNDKEYTSGEDFDTLQLERGVTITTSSPLSIAFLRPNLNPWINGAQNAGGATVDVTVNGITEQVVVTDVGGISVP